MPKLTDLHADKKNPRKHNERNLQVIADSLRDFGFARSIVIDEDNNILAGNGVTQAAALAGLDNVVEVEADGQSVIAVRRRGLTDEQKQRLKYADNRSSELAAWDAEQLLADLKAGVDLAGLFDQAELDALLRGMVEKEPVTDPGPQIDRAQELLEKWQVKPGDMFALGKHRLVCGDCTDRATVERLMGGEKPTCVITDPPYGMSLDASYSNSVDNPKKGIKASRGYSAVIGDDKPFDPSFLFEMFNTKEMFLFGGDYFAKHLPDGGSWIVWDKRASVEDLEYSSSEFELCWSRTPHHRFILRVPWFGIIGTEQQDTQKRLHPTQKPLGVIIPLIDKYGGDIIFDCFAGSGTTLIACEQLDRQCRAIEIDASYCAVTLQRWADATGQTPVLLDE